MQKSTQKAFKIFKWTLITINQNNQILRCSKVRHHGTNFWICQARPKQRNSNYFCFISHTRSIAVPLISLSFLPPLTTSLQALGCLLPHGFLFNYFYWFSDDDRQYYSSLTTLSLLLTSLSIYYLFLSLFPLINNSVTV